MLITFGLTLQLAGLGWASTLKDSSLLRISKTVYLKSSLKEWRILVGLASKCVNSSFGNLVLFEVADRSKMISALDFLGSENLKINEVLEREEQLEDFLFLLRLELYRSNRPSSTRIKFNPNCLARETKSLSEAEVEELVVRLNHFESLLRDRVGIDANIPVRNSLSRRRIELINSLREAMKGQYSYQWLLPRQ